MQGIGPEQYPVAQRPAVMAVPTPQITEVGGTFKWDKAGQGLYHERFMPESAPPAHAAGLFHVRQNYFRRQTALATWD